MTENSAMIAYFKNLANKPLLTRDEEQTIFVRISNGDPNAKNELIERNLRLVIPTVKQYMRCGIPFADLVQEGNLAIVTACDKFDPSLGNKFSTYATYWIRQRISRYVKKHAKNVFVPEHIVNLAVQIAKVRRMLASNGNDNPSPTEILNKLLTAFNVKTDIETVNTALESCQAETSMSVKIGENEDTEFGDTLVDTLTADPALSLEHKTVFDEINRAMSKISAYERKVVIARYGIGVPENGMTVSDIAHMFNVNEDEIAVIADKCKGSARSCCSKIAA